MITAYKTPLLTCLIGSLGGAIFAWLGAPLPWLIGAMLINAAGALLGWRPAMPTQWRNMGLVVLGVAVGSTYDAQSMDHIGSYLASMAVVALYSAVAGGVCTFYLVKVAKFDLATAYFSAMPGGMNEMVIVGEQNGANPRIVALSHAVRVLVVVTLIAFAFRIFADYARPDLAQGGALDLPALAILFGVAAVCVLIARKLRLPAPYFLGPIIGSVALHTTGLSEVAPPYALLALGQVIVGSALGARFKGTTVSELAGTARHATVVSVLQMIFTALFAILAAGLLPRDATTLFLGMAPAGIAEMSLIAVAVGYDVAFVAVHQLTRLLLVFSAAPLLFKLDKQRKRKR